MMAGGGEGKPDYAYRGRGDENEMLPKENNKWVRNVMAMD